MARYIVLSHDQADNIRMVPPHKYDARELFIELPKGVTQEALDALVKAGIVKPPVPYAILPVEVLEDPEFQQLLATEKIDIGDYSVIERDEL